MLSEEQLMEIKEHLEKAQNPLFFFDNDADGLCSFLILSRFIERGKGVAIKSFPDLNENYARKIYELKPDYVFVLDKPVISDGFYNEVKELNLPLVWIDHHDIDSAEAPDWVYCYNPSKQKNQGSSEPSPLGEKTSEPTSYWCWQATEKKDDLWLALAGCIGDSFLPDFYKQVKEKYLDLFSTETKNAFQILYDTRFGEMVRAASFGLKDRTTNVVRMLKFLLQVKNPYEVLEETGKNSLMWKRFRQVNSKYQKLLEKARVFVRDEKLFYFQYGGELSLSADIANELYYRYPDKIIVVAYLKGTKANISLRGKGIKEITEKSIEGIENATGGGHEEATGAQMSVDDLPKFRDKIEMLVK